ncbi:alpha/beta hydrolase [Fragilaria crotonensis]|nr:alpha/beta hydrolase [Fragilaria crotonensis]
MKTMGNSSRRMFSLWWTLTLLSLITTTNSYTATIPPKISPATGLPNEIYKWRADQQIRYQVEGPIDGEPVVLVHGLFVNADHWRHTIHGLASKGYRAYAIDLWGCGYSSKPPRDSHVAQSLNGEVGRFSQDYPNVAVGAELGTASGKETRVVNVELSHPLNSPYNFYTWANQITDFCNDVVKPKTMVTLVANSIGVISALQAVIDKPDLYRGVFAVSPNFRELHSAEVAFPEVSMPIIRSVQKLLRERGQPLFDALAKPSTVKQILKEPYAVASAVDDVLVDVLLTPLLTEGASQVVFDLLSYSAGPLPELQLSQISKPVWICYGTSDPWTPAGRVEALLKKPTVERVVALKGVGHCPHDEAPELVEPLLLEYLNRVLASQ